MLLALAACGGGGGNAGGNGGNAGGNAPDAGSGGGKSGPISLTLWGGEEDQSLLADLVDAGALMNLDNMDQALQGYAGKSIADIKAANVPVSVEAATYNGTMYAFPATADNGYFLYYDRQLV